MATLRRAPRLEALLRYATFGFQTHFYCNQNVYTMSLHKLFTMLLLTLCSPLRVCGKPCCTVVGVGAHDDPFVKQHLICCTCGTEARCLPSLVREGGPRQRWMSSPMGKLLYIRNYSSVSLTAATFPDKGGLSSAHRSFIAPNTVCGDRLNGSSRRRPLPS